ncbi:unnamed protein product, partial [Ilex paraguariensis]
LWAWERLLHIRPQRLLPRAPLHNVHQDVGPVDDVPPAPALVHGVAPHVPALDNLSPGPRGSR